jgi:hypothetical protein
MNELVTEIKQAINTYLARPDVDEQIGDDAYSIQLFMENEETILTITLQQQNKFSNKEESLFKGLSPFLLYSRKTPNKSTHD